MLLFSPLSSLASSMPASLRERLGMSVDLEAIAQRGRCDVSNLRLALPLLEQGYTPPFLARYRRDELGGLDEANLWALAAAMRTQQQVAERREELYQAWQQTPLADPSIGHATRKANP